MTNQRQWSRRRWLAAAGSTAAVGLAGCSSDDGTGGTDDDGSTPGGNSGNGDTSNPDGGTSEQSFEGPVTANGEWTHLDYDAANTRATTASGPPVAVQERWSNTLDSIASVPLVSGETVYAATEGGSCYAFDLLSGEKQWEQNLGPETIFSLATDDSRVYVGWAGGVSAITADNTVAWDKSLEEFIFDLVVTDGTVYARGQERLFARDAETGDELWTTAVPDGLSDLAVTNDSVLVKDRQQLKAYETGSGDRQWTVEHAGIQNDVGVSVADGTAYFVTDGRIEARSTADGSLSWEWTDGTMIRTVPTIADGMVYAGGRGEPGPYRIDAGNGQTLDQIDIDGYTGQPVVADGTVYFSVQPDLDADLRLYAVDADSLETRWQTIVPGYIENFPMVLEDLVVYGTESAVYVLEPA
ncbi:Outer membrane protein assembly factor BamB, contains PQQ-like beta-propeller repeat [Halorientalis persicus]|uniref:Outer membrane protein assembly factor BamB, contains PQQ-like beta-propeller repeat n=1 Tax=Halorientalis persicus TaxID=1367881 RepID=A0A1H8FLS2_9EURY|nr:PQQ-binding-like beta-propeller repeat protein [Halorientalis persicus]SEN32606.1 Outer membrane protein assembly factor BamB, contains PQQ-like beta-propeller repeat [Halorientalis persicus]